MAKLLKLRRGTTTEHNSFTGAEGEVTVDTTKDALVVHDGSTQGGHPVAKSSDVAGFAALTGATFTGNVLIDNAQTLRLGEADGSGTNFTGIKAQAQSGDITLTLPAVAPTANQVLKADGSTPTTLTWASDVQLTLINSDTFSGASTSNVNSATGTKNYVDTQVATKQASDAELTELATMASGTAGALADLLQAEVEILDGATLSTTELNYVKDVTSAIQTQLNAKQAADADTAKTDTLQAWTKPQVGTPGAITHGSAGAMNIDLSSTNNFEITLNAAGTLTFTNFTNAKGQTGLISIKNGGTHAVTYADHVLFPGGTDATVTATANAITLLSYYVYDVTGSSEKVIVNGIADVKDS